MRRQKTIPCLLFVDMTGKRGYHKKKNRDEIDSAKDVLAKKEKELAEAKALFEEKEEEFGRSIEKAKKLKRSLKDTRKELKKLYVK